MVRTPEMQVQKRGVVLEGLRQCGGPSGADGHICDQSLTSKKRGEMSMEAKTYLAKASHQVKKVSTGAVVMPQKIYYDRINSPKLWGVINPDGQWRGVKKCMRIRGKSHCKIAIGAQLIRGGKPVRNNSDGDFYPR